MVIHCFVGPLGGSHLYPIAHCIALVYSLLFFIVCLIERIKYYLVMESDHPGLLVCRRRQARVPHHEGSRADGGTDVEPGPAKLVAAHTRYCPVIRRLVLGIMIMKQAVILTWRILGS